MNPLRKRKNNKEEAKSKIIERLNVKFIILRKYSNIFI